MVTQKIGWRKEEEKKKKKKKQHKQIIRVLLILWGSSTFLITRRLLTSSLFQWFIYTQYFGFSESLFEIIRNFPWFFKSCIFKKKLTHIQVKNIKYNSSITPEKYLTNPKFDNDMRSLLFNLRCKSVNNFQDNFHTMYGKEPLCRFCKTNIDSQEHALSCYNIKQELSNTELDKLNSIKYSDLFGSENQQLLITKMYQRILEIHQSLIAKSSSVGLPGQNNSGPNWQNYC